LGLEGQDPASAYRANKGSKKASFFHTSGMIKTLLRNMAKRTFNSVNLVADNLLFTGHSFRAGAAVLLHAGGADGKDIQTWLCWKSDTFLMYLRDVPQIALNHVRMLNLADVENWESRPGSTRRDHPSLSPLRCLSYADPATGDIRAAAMTDARRGC
jgi:integrase